MHFKNLLMKLKTILFLTANILLISYAISADKSIIPQVSSTRPSDLITKSEDQITFNNKYFDVSVKKPKTWYAQSYESTQKLMIKGTSLVAGGDEGKKALLQESAKASIPLFGFFSDAPGSPVPSIASVISMTENIVEAPGVKTGCDYLFHVRNSMKSSNLKYSSIGECSYIKVNGINIGRFNAQRINNDITISQYYYACIRNRDAIAVIQTYHDEPSLAATDLIIRSLKVGCTS
jgi:hypothetical protein